MSGNAVQFHYAARSGVDLIHPNSQGSGHAGTNLLVLADGMGGPVGGDIASSVALAHLVPLDTDSYPADSMLPLLREAFLDVHEEFTDRLSRDHDLKGLGTICVAIVYSGSRPAVVHIGDSRAYVLRGDTFTQVTIDRSFVQYLVDTGQITPEEVEHHPNRSAVLKILGDARADMAPNETIREAVVDDRWMLCSDGLSGVVPPETIGQVMADFKDPGECAEEFIRLAPLGGGPDNIACAITDIVPADTFPPAPPQIVGTAAIDRNVKPRDGDGTATRTAVLGSPASGTPSDEVEVPVELKPRPSWWTSVFVSLVTVFMVAASWMSWKWTQAQYYVIGQDGHVVIYWGIPQSVGPWQLSHAVEVTNVVLSDLAPVDRQCLDISVLRSSRADIDSYIEGLRHSVVHPDTSSSPTPQSGAPQFGETQPGAQSEGAP